MCLMLEHCGQDSYVLLAAEEPKELLVFRSKPSIGSQKSGADYPLK